MANFTIPEKLMSCLAPLPDAVKGKILFAIFNLFSTGSQPDTTEWTGEERSVWAFSMQMLAAALRRSGITTLPPTTPPDEPQGQPQDPPRDSTDEPAAAPAEPSIADYLDYINAGQRFEVSAWQCRDESGREHTVLGAPAYVVRDALSWPQPSLHRRIREAQPDEYPCPLPFKLYMYHALPQDRPAPLAVLPDLNTNPQICRRL